MNRASRGRFPCGRSGETDLPVVEDGEAEGLALRVRPQVRLEAERVDGGQERLDGVERGPGHRRVLRHVTPEETQRKVKEHFPESEGRASAYRSLVSDQSSTQSSLGEWNRTRHKKKHHSH